ncbi:MULTISPECIES: restriction endonuclease subunit S [unclassified Pseudoalteromonas]|uniref:restriction endonuclease subunit S n=1 Tax=unclassified Pseudoalteromonas TaxID=194690 RepID=UPI001C718C97|nr:MULTISPECIES: restriction endonuclease subunit S [unclassified Pseudoalteromonas]
MAELAAMPKYEVYKDSGVDWLGEAPNHWDLLANKHIFKLKKKQVGKHSSEYDLLSLTLKGIIKRDMENPEGKFPAEFDTYQEVKKGDFVFCLFDVEETPRTVGLSAFDGMITGAYTVFEPKPDFDKNFLYYFYLNLDSKKRLRPLYRGLRNTIPKESFLGFKTFVPPLTEQTAIANFLDKKTAQIDEAVATKEKQIGLLKVRKQIIIQKTVTQGINPDTPKVDSGVDWIGEIPEHWEISKVRYLGTTQNGISAGAEYFGSGFPFVSYGDVYKNRELPSKVSGLAKSSTNDRKQYSILENDILFTRTSETAEEIGFASICMKTIEDSTFAGFLIRFRPAKRLFKGFSKYYFNAAMMREYFVKEMNLVIRASLSQELLKNLPVLLPSLDEQELIFNYLENKTRKIEDAIDIQVQQIEKLKEYKTTLINSAVTGKIKVPELMADR